MCKRIRTLLVDDSRVILGLLRRELEAWGPIEVVGEAGNGFEAVEFVEVLQPELVIMDCRMPVMDGLQATRRIKACGEAPKVILISIEASEMLEALARAAGADGFCDKAALHHGLPRMIDALFAVC